MLYLLRSLIFIPILTLCGCSYQSYEYLEVPNQHKEITKKELKFGPSPGDPRV